MPGSTNRALTRTWWRATIPWMSNLQRLWRGSLADYWARKRGAVRGTVTGRRIVGVPPRYFQRLAASLALLVPLVEPSPSLGAEQSDDLDSSNVQVALSLNSSGCSGPPDGYRALPEGSCSNLPTGTLFLDGAAGHLHLATQMPIVSPDTQWRQVLYAGYRHTWESVAVAIGPSVDLAAGDGFWTAPGLVVDVTVGPFMKYRHTSGFWKALLGATELRVVQRVVHWSNDDRFLRDGLRVQCLLLGPHVGFGIQGQTFVSRPGFEGPAYYPENCGECQSPPLPMPVFGFVLQVRDLRGFYLPGMAPSSSGD